MIFNISLVIFFRIFFVVFQSLQFTETMNSKLSYPAYIKENYKDHLLQSVKSIPCDGYFDFKCDNGYAFLNVDRKLATSALSGLRKEGFSLRYIIRKQKYPGST